MYAATVIIEFLGLSRALEKLIRTSQEKCTRHKKTWEVNNLRQKAACSKYSKLRVKTIIVSLGNIQCGEFALLLFRSRNSLLKEHQKQIALLTLYKKSYGSDSLRALRTKRATKANRSHQSFLKSNKSYLFATRAKWADPSCPFLEHKNDSLYFVKTERITQKTKQSAFFLNMDEEGFTLHCFSCSFKKGDESVRFTLVREVLICLKIKKS